MLSARFTDVFARCIWIFDGYTIPRLLHRIQNRSIGVDVHHCVWIRVDGLSCQAFSVGALDMLC